MGGVDWCDWGSGSETPPDVVVNVTGGPGQPPDSSSGEITISAHSAVNDGNTVTFTVSHPDLMCSEFDNRAQLIIDADKSDYNGPMSGCTFSYWIANGSLTMDIWVEISAADYPQLSDDIDGWSFWDRVNPGGVHIYQFDLFEYVEVGAPFRAFRAVQYGIYQDGGRWWLGRKVGSAGTYEQVAGPLRAPGDSGLHMIYYDASGNPTADPRYVQMVDIILRGESLGLVPRGDEAPSAQQDTLTVRVSIRG